MSYDEGETVAPLCHGVAEAKAIAEGVYLARGWTWFDSEFTWLQQRGREAHRVHRRRCVALALRRAGWSDGAIGLVLCRERTSILSLLRAS
jgi:hypothetical protein